MNLRTLIFFIVKRFVKFDRRFDLFAGVVAYDCIFAGVVAYDCIFAGVVAYDCIFGQTNKSWSSSNLHFITCTNLFIIIDGKNSNLQKDSNSSKSIVEMKS